MHVDNYARSTSNGLSDGLAALELAGRTGEGRDGSEGNDDEGEEAEHLGATG